MRSSRTKTHRTYSTTELFQPTKHGLVRTARSKMVALAYAAQDLSCTRFRKTGLDLILLHLFLLLLKLDNSILEYEDRHPSGQHTLFPALSFKTTFSPTVVVDRSGPGLFPRSWPNFDQFFLSATACWTIAFCIVRRILLVICITLPSGAFISFRHRAHFDGFTLIIYRVFDCRDYPVLIYCLLWLP